MMAHGNLMSEHAQTHHCALDDRGSTRPPERLGSFVGSPDEGEDGMVDKKVRHNKVEQNRREMTRRYVAELQEMLPSMVGVEAGAGINVVLEGTLEYLRSSDGGGTSTPAQRRQAGRARQGAGGAAPARFLDGEAEAGGCQLMAGRACGQINVSSLRFSTAFETAPFGIVIARCDGRLLKCNSMFEQLLNFTGDAGAHETMFSLTAPSDLAYTMQVVGGLLTGSDGLPANFNKRCVRKGNNKEHIDVNVQMSCIWEGAQPKCFVCYLRTRDGEGGSLPQPQLAIPALAGHRVQMMSSSGGSASEDGSQMSSPFDTNDYGSPGHDDGEV
eukprot:Tamp_08821.p1 GENE.Tamp_08821~~Tamp_08821.p1  ORF type:complete len:328 (-),score=74.40 Tamp_08821:217-1200(-)